MGQVIEPLTGSGDPEPLTQSEDYDELLLSRLTVLATRSWWDLDHNGGARFHEYFTESGVFDFAGNETQGREALREHFRLRRARGDRTSVHVLTNFSIDVHDIATATLHMYVCVFGADGLGVQPIGLPTLVGTIEDAFERQADGCWLIIARRFSPMFYNPDDRIGSSVSEFGR